MAKLRGFKFTSNGYRKDNIVRRYLLDNERNYLEYAILSESDGRFFIDDYYNGTNHRYDITDKMDVFYNEIKDLGIEKWNMKTYESSMCWTPPADYWTLEIHIEDISVICKGQGTAPEGWNEFWKAFHRMCHN